MESADPTAGRHPDGTVERGAGTESWEAPGIEALDDVGELLSILSPARSDGRLGIPHRSGLDRSAPAGPPPRFAGEAR